MECTDCNRETTYLITSFDQLLQFENDYKLWCADKRQAVTVYLNTRLGGQTKEERTAKALRENDND